MITDIDENKIRTVISAFDGGKSVTELPLVKNIQGGESLEIIQNGESKRATLAMLRSAAQDSNGVYPDVPLNRVTMKRFSGQTSTQVVFEDNVSLVNELKKTAYPVLLGRDGRVAAYLNGSDITKTEDGLEATLTDWTLQAMVRVGGFYYKYTYVAATNEKIYNLSPYKVRGYKYIRRRFLNMYGGSVYNDGTKNYLVSNSGKWTTQSVNLINFHAYAKNLGTTYRAMATQDREVYRLYFWLYEGTFNSQSILRGICDVNSTNWSTFSQVANGGQSSYGQFHKTGETNTILGHKGEKTITVTGFPAGDISVKPYKWLWRENMLSGPYWVWETGYMFLGNKVYRAKDINNITVDGITSANISTYYDYLFDMPSSSGYILENYQDTLIPSLLGATDSVGMCDYFWRPLPVVGTTVYIPAGVGNAYYGSYLGVSVLNPYDVASSTGASYGGALASDDPTDGILDGTVVG